MHNWSSHNWSSASESESCDMTARFCTNSFISITEAKSREPKMYLATVRISMSFTLLGASKYSSIFDSTVTGWGVCGSRAYQTMPLDLQYNAADTCNFCRFYKPYGDMPKRDQISRLFCYFLCSSVQVFISLQLYPFTYHIYTHLKCLMKNFSPQPCANCNNSSISLVL